MKKHPIKLMTVLLIASLLLSVVSCGKPGNDYSKAKKVLEDSTWWNDTITKVTPEDIRNELDDTPYQISSRVFAADEESFVLSTYIISSKTRANTILRHYTYEGELLGQINLGKFFGYDEEYYDPNVIYKKDGKYYTFISHYDKYNDSMISTGYEIDFNGGVLKEPFTLELPDDAGGRAELNTSVVTDNKLVCLLNIWNKDFSTSYEFCVYDGDKPRTVIPAFGNNIKINYINNLMANGSNVTFIASVNNNGLEKTYYCTLNIDTFDIKTVETDRNIEMAQFVSGCGVFDNTDMKTISKIDPSTGDKNTLVDMSDTYIYGMYGEYDTVVWASDDKVVLLANKDDLSQRLQTANIVLLKKADKNPNAGKALLSIASLDHMTEQEFFAISEFNRNSKKVFIEVNNKYYDVVINGWRSQALEEDNNLKVINAFEADAVTLLMSDIREGTGPDIVIYTNESGQLDNENFLIDLSSRIKSEKSLNNGDYMSFISQPDGRDGKHYRLDYGFSFDGLVINNSFIDDGMKGLTFEQYDQIINDKNNGVNILPKDKLYMMKALIKCGNYLVIDKDGKLSLGNDGFKAMADYISAVPEGTRFDNDLDDKIRQVKDYASTFRSYSLYYNQAYSDYSIIGKPTSDGHAETINGRGIGITSCCVLRDAAWDFAMSMMTPEVQYQAFLYDPVLISTQRTLFNDYIKSYNASCNPEYNERKLPEGIVDKYIEQISDAVVVPDIDSSMMVIFDEEMPAYFEGQKSFDEVIKIIENRVNLMLAERG